VILEMLRRHGVEGGLGRIVEYYGPGLDALIWRVDIVFLDKTDWKYEKSDAGEGGGGRTHTFGVKNAAKKLATAAVYRRSDVIVRDGKPIPKNGHGDDEEDGGYKK